MLYIGRDAKTEEPIYIDASRSRAVLICGKRGSGKSYTLGVIVEELFELADTLIVIIDTMGIFHTMALPNIQQEKELWSWGIGAKGFPIKLLVPGEPEVRYGSHEVIAELNRRGIYIEPFRLNPGDLSPDGWCEFLELSINEVMGIALYRAAQALSRKRKKFFILSELIDQIAQDSRSPERTKEALINRLEWAIDIDIFSTSYQELWEVFDLQAINVIDLSVLDPSRYGLRSLILAVLARDLFNKRAIARRKEELNISSDLPKVWLAIDEAHQFAPAGRSALSKDALIRWVKEGRQPGLSVALASQQPAAIDNEIISQCDIILSHKLTNVEDIQAVNKLSQDYMATELRTLIRSLNRRGEAVLVDDEREQVNMVQIRPRRSHHGGGESK